jgi:hypothetical protein
VPVPSYGVGQVLPSADVDQWFLPIVAQKAADTSRASNTTLSADPDLVVTVSANATYEFTCFLRHSGATTPGDIKWNWVIPSGALLRYTAVHNEGSTTGLGNSIIINAAGDVVFDENGAATGTEVGAFLHGFLNVAATAANVQLQWAQNASSGTATILKQYSHLILRRIA